MVEDGGTKLDNAGEYALEQYSQDSGAGWWSVGLTSVTAATKALAAANEAHALSIDPHAVDSMLKKLTDMQDELAKPALQSMQVGYGTPLGRGYAEDIDQVNKQLGRYVFTDTIPKLTQAIDDLKAAIEKCRASYQNVDATNAVTINKAQGH